jgi:hypothetical protein
MTLRQEADRYVDLCHADAMKAKDPVAFLRTKQVETERAFFNTGAKVHLERLRAFERSLGAG